MLRSLRWFLPLLSFASLQISLFGGGAGCSIAEILAAGTNSAAMATSEAPAMDMPGMSSGETSSTERTDNCDEPTAIDCSSMTVCVLAAVTAPSSVAIVRAAPAARVATVAVLAPPSEGDAPDLPPPRA